MKDLEKLYKLIKKDNWRNKLDYQNDFIITLIKFLDKKLSIDFSEQSLSLLGKITIRNEFLSKYIGEPLKEYYNLQSFHYTKIMEALRRFK